MLSRVAESMFWMSRYMERAENTARFLDVHYHLLLDLHKVTGEQNEVNHWEPLILAASDHKKYIEHGGLYDASSVTEFLVFDRDNLSSVVSCISLARENARGMFQSISSEMWEQVNNVYHFLMQSNLRTALEDPYRFYQNVKQGVHLFHGIMENTLSRNEGWHFLQAGRYLERADNTSRLLDVKYQLLRTEGSEEQESIDVIQWMAVLKSCSGLEAFRKVYLARIEPEPILEYLVLDREFPRSIFTCASGVEQALWNISGGSRHNYTNPVDRMIGQVMAELSYITVEDIIDRDINKFLSALQGKFAQINDQIHKLYFAHHIRQFEATDVELNLVVLKERGARASWAFADQQQQQQQ